MATYSGYHLVPSNEPVYGVKFSSNSLKHSYNIVISSLSLYEFSHGCFVLVLLILQLSISIIVAL